MKRLIYLSFLLSAICFSSCSLFGSCSELDKTIEQVFEDGKLNDQELEDLMTAFDNDDDYSESTQEQRLEHIKEVCSDKGLSCKKEAQDMILSWGEEEEKPVVVNVYLDNTQSMSGYILSNNNGSFTGVFSSAVGFYSNKSVTVHAYYTQSSGTGPNKRTSIQSVDFKKLESDLTGHTLNAFTDSYQLEDFFREISNKVCDVSSDEICYFFTDGIPSGTNTEIRNNPKFSISQKTTLQKRIADAIRPCHGHASAAVYRFKGSYKGEYWKYNNNHQTRLNDLQRPFYVIVVGKTKLVKDFADQVKNGLNGFRPEEYVLFLNGDNKFGPNKNKYVAKVKDDYIYLKDRDDSQSNTVKLSFNSNNLPSYIQDESSIKKSVSFEYDGDELEYEIEDNRITIEFDIDSNDTKELIVKVKDILPTWITTCSSDDDSSLSSTNASELSKTFNLDILVEGIKQGITNRVGQTYYMNTTYQVDTNQRD